MVRLVAVKANLRRLRLVAPCQRLQEGGPVRQRRGDQEDRVRAAEERAVEHEAADADLDRQGSKVAAERREGFVSVERIGALERDDSGLHRGRLRRVERARKRGAQLVALEQRREPELQAELLQWPAQHLGHPCWQHGLGVPLPRVQLEGVPGTHATGTAGALPRLRLRDPHVDQPPHLLPLVKHSRLRAAGVNHKDGVVDGDGRFGDVGRQHHLAHARRHHVEDCRLLGGRERRVEWQHAKGGAVTKPARGAHRVVERGDVGETGQEHQDGSVAKVEVDVIHELHNEIVVDGALVELRQDSMYPWRIRCVSTLVVVGVRGGARLLPLLRRRLSAAVQVEGRLVPRAVIRDAARRVGRQHVSCGGEYVLEESVGDGIRATLRREHRAATKVAREELRLHRRRHAHHPQVGTQRKQLAKEEEEQIGLRVPLVHLVHHYVRDALERLLAQHHPQCDARGAVEQPSRLRPLRLETHLVPDQ
mmetsp:Transcript_47802/g.154566  ORF Transcript_47802/g.154566 Transcript_47802/m.154566 type:complete len:478 (-) Transcript_47802:2130-3563(-)